MDGETIHIGPCDCGGYGQVIADPGDEGRCHIPLDELTSDDDSHAVERKALQAAIYLLPCQEGRSVGSGVEFDSTIQHAPTCPAHYITAVANALAEARKGE